MDTEILRLLISIVTPIAAIVGIGWFGLDRMEQRIKADAQQMEQRIREDAQKAHDQIGLNIETLRSEIRSDTSGIRSELSDMRKEITDLTGRVGRIEGMLEGMRDASKSTPE